MGKTTYQLVQDFFHPPYVKKMYGSGLPMGPKDALLKKGTIPVELQGRDQIDPVDHHDIPLIWVCLKIVYPYTQWLMIIIPTKWL